MTTACGLQAQQPAQEIAQKVKQTGDGTLTLVFASKPGVCGNGRNSINWHRDDGDYNYNSNSSWNGYRHCEEGPLQVELTIDNGEVVELNTWVAGTPRPNIVKVGTAAAASYLLNLAQTSNSLDVAKRSILPAILADSVEPYPELLRIARNDRIPGKIRKDAIFWLGQAAGDKVAGDLKNLTTDGDTEVKKSAVFALSQIRGEASVNALIEVAKTSKDREVRKNALFWLAQSNDPRALSVFEDILIRK
ncbi:MAG TPA: HEAT repeat domain-containing protein [Longimicrobiales bacterium]|nr:HEAT repeat domain-containing protein [Longimicrobiales bacterium]